MKKIGIALAAILTATALTPAMARPHGWLLVGSRSVSGHVDHDEIVLAGHRRYNQMKVCVSKRAVHFINVNVKYENWQDQNISIASEIAPGDCTRDIDLAGHDRDIRDIQFTYDAAGWHRRQTATVRVYVR